MTEPEGIATAAAIGEDFVLEDELLEIAYCAADRVNDMDVGLSTLIKAALLAAGPVIAEAAVEEYIKRAQNMSNEQVAYAYNFLLQGVAKMQLLSREEMAVLLARFEADVEKARGLADKLNLMALAGMVRREMEP